MPLERQDDVQRLRNTMRDLVALSTLPAVWAGYAPQGIVESLAEVLASTLSLDLVFVRAGDVEAVRGKGFTADHVSLVAEALTPWLTPAESPVFLTHPLDGGELRVAVSRFGHSGSDGVAVVCSRRPDFPGESDRLLLGVGANQTAIVLQRKKAERALADERERLRVTLSSIGDAVISTDSFGRVTFMNPVAEALTGWTQSDAVGRPLSEVFRIVNETTRQPVENPAIRALQQRTIVGLANHTLLIARDGTERPIDDSAAPIGDRTGVVLVFRDVTERKRAEEAQARLAAIVESSGDAIISKTLDGIIRSWNAGAERLFGYTPGEAIGKHITLVIPRDRFEEEREILERLRRGERVESFETVRVTKGGRQIDVSLTVSPIHNDRGEVVAASKVARDVTERRRAETELRRLAETHALALDAGELGTWEWDPATDGMTLSARAAEIYGVEQGPHRREQLRTLLHPTHCDRAREIAARAAAEQADYDLDYPLTSGRWVAVRGRGVYDATGSMTRMIGVVQDVTARKGQEVSVRRSEGLLRLATDAAELGVWVWDVAADQVTWENDRHYEIFGLDRSAGPVNAARFRDEFVHPDDAEAFGLAVAEAVKTGDRFHFEGRLRKTDGEVRWVEFNGLPLRTDDGTPLRMHGTAADITERKRAEEELRDQDRKKDEFIALLAHELRNPLAPIRNGLGVLRLSGENPEVAQETREMMERQITHMVRLIDDLLDISRINQNKIDLRLEPVTLAEVISSAVETAQPTIDAAGHELTVTLPSKPIDLDADLTRLAQVFSNLLTNSAKYTHRGGKVWLTAVIDRERVSVSVRDTGIGIPKADLPNIFDMFSQVDRSIERTTGGLGIGLALVKGLTEMHGGTVTVASEGVGSTFTVTLPVLAGRTESLAATDPRPSKGKSYRILVVDDSQDGAKSLSRLLRLLGHEVHTAFDGLEAVEAAREYRPEVVLMDVGMPGLNGYEATRQIRDQDWGEGMTIIALTGWGQDGDRKLSRQAGCDGHLVKPVNLPDLEKMLDELKAAR